MSPNESAFRPPQFLILPHESRQNFFAACGGEGRDNSLHGNRHSAKDLNGRVACKLEASNYGTNEWWLWLLLE